MNHTLRLHLLAQTPTIFALTNTAVTPGWTSNMYPSNKMGAKNIRCQDITPCVDNYKKEGQLICFVSYPHQNSLRNIYDQVYDMIPDCDTKEQ